LLPLKNELSYKVLEKTAIPRSVIPKVVIERIAIKAQNMSNVIETTDTKTKTDKVNVNFTLKNSDQFIFLRAFEQLRD